MYVCCEKKQCFLNKSHSSTLDNAYELAIPSVCQTQKGDIANRSHYFPIPAARVLLFGVGKNIHISFNSALAITTTTLASLYVTIGNLLSRADCTYLHTCANPKNVFP
jgi:hypothetical protein